MTFVVLQSHPETWRGTWIDDCTTSVAVWADTHGYEHRLEGDATLAAVPAWFRRRVGDRGPIVADLARLQWASRVLDEGAAGVIWVDADTYIWQPDQLQLPEFADACFSRECWVQRHDGKLRVYRSVSNAFCAFARGGVTLPFLQQAVLGIVERAEGAHIAPQMVGPKLLTALGNIVGFTTTDAVGALSPEVLEDLLCGGGPALQRMLTAAAVPLLGANLCASLHGLEAQSAPASWLRGENRQALQADVFLGN